MKLLHPILVFPLFLADIAVPWPATQSWLLGLLGAASFLYVILGTINQGRKLFGRTPPIDEDLQRLNSSLKKELKDQTDTLTDAMGDLQQKTEDAISEMRIDRLRTWEALKGEIGEVKTEVAFIRGSLQKHRHS